MPELEGLGRVVKVALEAMPARRSEVEAQGDLFGELPRAPGDEGAAVVSVELPALTGDRAALELSSASEGDRAKGRPPGSLNRRTMAWASYLLERRGSPLDALAQVWAMPIDQLAKALGCTRLEAARERREAARVSLPYLHSPMPTRLNVSGRGALAFAVVSGGMAGGDHHTMVGPDEALELAAEGLTPPELEQFQADSGEEDGKGERGEANGQGDSALRSRA